jgi:hypothetical protein
MQLLVGIENSCDNAIGVRGLSEVASHSGGLEVDCAQAFIEQPLAKQMS